jgi:hypothetical protein
MLQTDYAIDTWTCFKQELTKYATRHTFKDTVTAPQKWFDNIWKENLLQNSAMM